MHGATSSSAKTQHLHPPTHLVRRAIVIEDGFGAVFEILALLPAFSEESQSNLIKPLGPGEGWVWSG